MYDEGIDYMLITSSVPARRETPTLLPSSHHNPPVSSTTPSPVHTHATVTRRQVGANNNFITGSD